MNQSIIIKSITLLSFVAINLLGYFQQSFAQNEDLKQTLQQLSEDAARQYVAPISSAFGADLNGGWFHKAPEATRFKLDIEIGIMAMGAFFPKNSKSFAVNGQFRFSTDQANQLINGMTNPPPEPVRSELVRRITEEAFTVRISGATIIGARDEYITIDFPGKTYEINGNSYTIPSQSIRLGFGGFGDLAAINFLPFMTPQLSIGTVWGTRATFRMLPSITLREDLGKLSYFGFGLQHNPAVWLENPIPLDVAFSFSTQSFKVGDVFNANAITSGLYVSKQFGSKSLNLSPYVGFVLERTTMKVNYTYIVDTPTGPDETEISFELESANKIRFIMGVNMNLFIVDINADYNFSQYNSFTLGLTMGW